MRHATIGPSRLLGRNPVCSFRIHRLWRKRAALPFVADRDVLSLRHADRAAATHLSVGDALHVLNLHAAGYLLTPQCGQRPVPDLSPVPLLTEAPAPSDSAATPETVPNPASHTIPSDGQASPQGRMRKYSMGCYADRAGRLYHYFWVAGDGSHSAGSMPAPLAGTLLSGVVQFGVTEFATSSPLRFKSATGNGNSRIN